MGSQRAGHDWVTELTESLPSLVVWSDVSMFERYLWNSFSLKMDYPRTKYVSVYINIKLEKVQKHFANQYNTSYYVNMPSIEKYGPMSLKT